MVQEIGVFYGSNGSTAQLDQPGKLTIFRRDQGVWTVDRELPVALEDCQGMAELRQRFSAVVIFLADCKILCAEKISGVAKIELEKAGVVGFEIGGNPGPDLESIWWQVKDASAPPAPLEREKAIQPSEIAPGHYTISLQEIQGKNAGLSSRQVLQPFIRTGQFVILEVLCSHVPPWLEQEVLIGKLSAQTKQLAPDQMLLTLKKPVME
jgi:Fe-only nitrogenase accessory protein AnfO